MAGLDDDQRKHLDFIQSVISRLSTDSFLVKGWALTIATAVYGYAASHRSWRVAAVGLLPAAAFWGLDSYYLWHERLYRALYNDARQPEKGVEPFSMNVDPYKKRCTWKGTIVSRTILPIHLLVVAVGIILMIDGASHHARSASHPLPKAALIDSRTSSWTCSLRFSFGGQISPTSSSAQRGTTCT